VPYTGANANVDLGEYELKAGQIELDTTPTGTAGVAVTRWNDTIGSSETTLKGGSVILKNGVDLVARIVNKVTPNTTLTKASYQVVRISGAQGQRLAVNLAQANNDNNSADTLGVVCETIATNQQGFIMTVGQLENINTTGSLQGETWSDGDVLYLSPTTAGRLTNVKPIAPAHIVIVGYVEYAHANNGKIYVKIMNGWELDELHNVAISTPLNNQGLIYETSTDLWKNKTIIEDSITNGVTTIAPSQNAVFAALALKQDVLTNPITGTGANGQVAFFNGTTTQAGDNGLFWDNTNKRLGIGTTSPQSRLDVRAQGALSTDIAFRVRNSADTANLVAIGGRGILTVGGIGHTGTIELARSTTGSIGGAIVQEPTFTTIRNYQGSGINLTVSGGTALEERMFVRTTGVGISGTPGGVFTMDPSALLQGNSTTQGFLPPRMTTTQKNAIVSPASGLVIYDTTLNKLCVRGASAWETITSI
jgi:nitrogen fixation protein